MNIATKQTSSCGPSSSTESIALQKVATQAQSPTATPLSKRHTVLESARPSSRIRAGKLALFVEEYLNANFNGSKAAIAVGYSRRSARVKASELLNLPEVAAAIEASIAARAVRTAIDTDDIVRRMQAIAFADPRELIEMHRNCCRYCYGNGHRYQWTPSELREAEASSAYEGDSASGRVKSYDSRRPLDVSGGTGFNCVADPNPECPECFGEGVIRVVAKDTRDLSPAARSLYAGIKKTQHGVEIKMNDQSAMLLHLGRHLGLFTTNLAVNGVFWYVNYNLTAESDTINVGAPDSNCVPI